MKVQEHFGKISWTFADKLLFVAYGFVTLLQIKALDPAEFGLAQLLLNLHNWIFLVSDSFALHGIIQFGAEKEGRGKVNTISLILHTSLVLGLALIVLTFGGIMANTLGQPRFTEIASLIPLLCLLNIPRTFCLKLIVREFRFARLFFSNFAYFGIMTALTLYYLIAREQLFFEDIVAIYFAGAAFSSLVTLLLAYKFIEFKYKGSVRIGQLLRFGIPLTVQSALHAFPRQLDIYIVQYFFTTSAVGVYSSAKSLFRVFEEAGNASYTLIYPAAVKQLKIGARNELNDLLTKAVSFMFIAFSAAIIMLSAGLSEMFITWFLPAKYYAAIGMFNLMLIAAFFIPITMVLMIIVASGKPEKSLKIVAVSVLLSIAAFLSAGFLGAESFLPAGIIAYNAGLAILGLIYVKKRWGFPVKQLFRAIPDTLHFIRKYTGKAGK